MVSTTLTAKPSDSLNNISNSFILKLFLRVSAEHGNGIFNFILSVLFSTKLTIVLAYAES
jgi:hypothetical protein